ncbi:hypothetical protein MLP_48510 [Microlunatus phosphovorus NM-1]|uniref:Uncharacterized protein n=1 Tax=Microlunatus phosphovorus (strain ATCC 700054 / DSM 10555 / JCM 9379 / NBRC 101784 / NCIMB 13414 / VKM Ac-1990 / NM-1) TaxID=1032480 RepID=F5XFC7_MICPN|nr:hypothetical protein MLP_48510 [Microlunatus phosphovorus NM-1]
MTWLDLMRLTPAPLPQIAPWLRDEPACLRHPHDRLWPAAPDVRTPARPAYVPGPAARNVPTSRPIPGRLWPRGAKRTHIPPGPRTSLAPRRKTTIPPARPACIFGPPARNVRQTRPASPVG